MGSLSRELAAGFPVGVRGEQVAGRNVACLQAAGGVGFCLGEEGETDQRD